MFGLSEHAASITITDILPFPPVQIQDSVSLPLLSPSDVPSEPDTVLHIPPAPKPKQTYLPTLQKFLPLDWSRAEYVVDKSAKSNDAEPVFRHWNERITLILPKATPYLDTFSRFLMTHLHISIYKEYLRYLTTKFGPS